MKPGYSVIVDYVRTPFARASTPGTGKKPGQLADADPVDMMVPLIAALMERTKLDPKHVKNVLTGVAHQEYTQGLNIARLAVLHPDSQLTQKTGGTTMDRFCGSSMEAVAVADAFLARNPDHVYICTGVQSMSQVPMDGINPTINRAIQDGNATAFLDMGTTAERLASIYKISREAQDKFSVASHLKAARAQADKRFDGELVPVNGLSHDDCVRGDSSVEALAKLKPVFKAPEDGGSVTAGSSSPITDGATAAMVTSEAFAAANNLPVKARILSFGESGLAPEIMGLGPVEASKEALQKAGLTMADIGAVELNEAFAAQSIAVLEEFNRQGMAVDPAKLNKDGGAIALGHPLGASGIRLVGHLAEIMKRENIRYGLATMCIGGGQGTAMVLENPHYAAPKSDAPKLAI
jgi:acetyl-CoA acyltransferase